MQSVYDAGVFASLLLSVLTAVAAPAGDTRVLDVNALKWTFDEERIVLGETTVSAITLTAKRSDGTPLDIAPPTLKASTGQLSAPVRTGPGIWRTEYTPPKERFPHVAMMSAQIDTDRGLAVGFAAVPLWGKGQLKVKTKPASTVVVSIGNLEFGPAKADDKGIASVDIIAPPGPERAVAKSLDEFGNRSKETVDLGVPPFNRLSLIALDDVAAADGTGEAQLLLYLVDKKGEAMIDAPVQVKANVGGLKQLPQGISPGLFRLRYGPGTTKLKQAVVDIALENAEASTATAKIALIPGGPRRAEIEQSASEVFADGNRQVQVAVTLFDQAGNPVPPTAGRAVVDVGRIDSQALDGMTATYRWMLPAEISRTSASAVDATAAPSTTAAGADAKTQSEAAPNEVENKAAPPKEEEAAPPFSRLAHFVVKNRAGDTIARSTVTLRPGAPHRLTLTPLGEMRGDGLDGRSFTATVVDVVGNPVSIDGIDFESDVGTVTAPEILGHQATGLFVASALPQGGEPQTGALTATLPVAGGEPLRTRAFVRVAPVRLRPLLLVGVGVASDYNLRTYASAGPELSLLLRLPYLDGQLHAGLRLGALAAVPLPTASGETEAHLAVPVWAEVQWRQALLAAVPDLSFHFGGAAGVTMSDRFLFDATGQKRASAAAPGAFGLVGVGYPLGPGAVEADVHAGFAWPLQTTLDWSPMALGLSVRYRFGL